MNLRSHRLLYLNPEKVRTLYGQMFGQLPTITVSQLSARGGASIKANLIASAGVEGGATKTSQSDVPPSSLVVQILEKLRTTKEYVPDREWKRFNQRLLHGSLSFLATVDGKFRTSPETNAEEWLGQLGAPGYVTLFLDQTERRVRYLKGHNANSRGIWTGMNTEHIAESARHLSVPLRGQKWIFLSVTGWVESSGYMNPLAVFW